MLSRLFVAAAAFTIIAGPQANAAEDLDAMLKNAIAGTKVPAIGALVMRDGKVVEQAVQGVRRNDGKDPVRLDDVWLIGSTGKVMTVAMVARLVEHGALSWDMPLEKMLPNLATTMRPEYRSVTLIQMLSHRAGLPRDIADRKFFDTFYTDRRPLGKQRLAYITEALKEAPTAAPGTAFSYSNSGFLIAAVIAETATALSYEELMTKEVFKPLNMSGAGFGNTHDGQPRGHQQGKPKTRMLTFDDGGSDMFSPAGLT